MTVCIGALCADRGDRPSRAVVVASDRMVTLGGLTEFEHEVPKVAPVAEKIAMLIAGDALRGARLVRELRGQIPAGPINVEHVANAAGVMYAEHRRQQVETEAFTPRGITMQQYYQGIQILPQIVGAIDQYMVGFNYGTEFLLTGVDDVGAHLFYLGNPGGAVSNFETIGFHAIGSGMLHALQSMIGFGQTPARGLHETVFNVYASKRRAEVAPGVGKDTDMLIVNSDGMTTVNGPMLQELEKLFQQTQQPIGQEVRKEMAKLPLFKEVGA